MGVIEIPSYRGTCDGPECKDSPQDYGEYYCWAEPDQVLTEAQDCDWYTVTAENGTIILLCPKHAPVCDCPGCDACKTYPDGSCKVRLRDDEFGKRCEDCFFETEDEV